MTVDPPDVAATPTRPLAPALAVLAALALGAAAMAGVAAVDEHWLRMLLAVVVGVVGLAVFTVARKPGAFGRPALRGTGSGLLVLGVHLLANSVFLALAVDPAPGLVVLVLYGAPALAMLLLAGSGMRVWIAAAGVLVPAVVASMVQLMADGTAVMGVPMLVMLVFAVLLTVAVVAAPAGAGWGDLAGAGAGIAATYAVGAGFSIVGSLVLMQAPIADASGLVARPLYWVQAVCACGAVLVAAVLLMVATVRRDPATGLLAASVLVLSGATQGHPFVWIPLVVLAVALVGLRVPAVRAALAAVPAALRERRPSGATTAAACAAVAGTALVMFAWKGLADLGVSGRPSGVVTAVILLVAGALAYFLPGAAGAALAVVTLVALFVIRPWAHLLDTPAAGGGVLGLLELATVVGAVWALGKRHAGPAVWAAAAYLVLGTLPDVLAPLLGLTGDAAPTPGGHAVVLVLPLVLVGLPAAVLAWRGPLVANWQAVGAVVLGSTLVLSAKLNLAVVLGADRGVRPADPISPLTPTDVVGSASRLDLNAVAVVAVTVIALAVVSVLSVARRPATPLAATATLAVFVMLPYAVGRLGSAASVLAWVLAVVAVVLTAVAVLAARHGSRDHLVHEV